MEQLRVEVIERGRWTVVAATGQLDVVTAADLRQHLLDAQLRSSRVAVDLDGLELLDSFGLGVLVGAVRRARSHAADLILLCTRAPLLRVLDLSGLATIIPVVATVADLPDDRRHAAAGEPAT